MFRKFQLGHFSFYKIFKLVL